MRFPDGTAGEIAVVDGRIAQLGAQVHPPAGAHRVEGRGRLILPGAVDPHVHFRCPGEEHKETLHSGAEAAVKGGVTTCMDMPNTYPPTTTVQALEAKLRLGEGAACHLYYHFGAAVGNLEQVRLAVRYPQVRAMKIYLGPSTAQEALSPEWIRRHMRQAAELGLPVIVHAEDPAWLAAHRNHWPADVYHHAALRGLEAELLAVEQVLHWSEEYGTQLCLAHVTSPHVVEAVLRHERPLAQVEAFHPNSAALPKLDVRTVWLEACPHHLVYATVDIAPPLENRYKVNPPLRDPAQREGLCAALRAGQIAFLGSDHAPHTLQEKQGDYTQAPSGMPGVEYLFPWALRWWRAGWWDTTRLIALSAGMAATCFGLSNKGRLVPGADADLVLVNEQRPWRAACGTDRVWSRCAWTPYEGQAFPARPEMTIVAGRVVWEAPADPQTESFPA